MSPAGLLKEAASGGVGVGKRHDGLKGLRGSQFFLRFFEGFTLSHRSLGTPTKVPGGSRDLDRS